MIPYKLEAGTAQHIGSRAQQNDRVALFSGARSPGYVMAVLADGVQGGATASAQALLTSKQLFDEFSAGDTPNPARLQALLRNIVDETHAIIKMSALAAHAESSCTLAILVLAPDGQAFWVHVGDTRVYRFSQGACVQRSSDDAYIDHLVRADGLPLEAARQHRRSRLLNNVLGSHLRAPFPTLGHASGLGAGDAFLLCSDGLWHFFTDAELAAVIGKNAPRMASELLINKAGERAQGKGDNCSMAIIRLVKPPREAPNYTVQKMGRAV